MSKNQVLLLFNLGQFRNLPDNSPKEKENVIINQQQTSNPLDHKWEESKSCKTNAKHKIIDGIKFDIIYHHHRQLNQQLQLYQPLLHQMVPHIQINKFNGDVTSGTSWLDKFQRFCKLIINRGKYSL